MKPYRGTRRKNSYRPAIIIILLALVLSYFAINNSFGIRLVFTSVIYPVQTALHFVVKGVVGIPSGVMSLRNLSQENKELKSRLFTSIAKLALFEELVNENVRLRQSLEFQGSNRYRFKLVVAQVVARGASPYTSLMEINQGVLSGVKVDMPVIVDEGLVGRVVEVSLFSSKILPITDLKSSVASVDQQNREFGVVEGFASQRFLAMKYVSSVADIQVGDKIVTSPASKIFPPGIPIGSVVSVKKKDSDLFFDVKVRPAVNFSKLEEVFLIFQ
ncbi:MAG: rod shape-determining protein MreC [Candidatus Margulisbacteria bacterium]|nr:rod shape-determining protein MreC [Candidatus Margulisiibacteriota bacterium]MBU1616940.1 rod shape-determining protein MreC [Candidatus Margulisiibacteriota bacterium]